MQENAIKEEEAQRKKKRSRTFLVAVTSRTKQYMNGWFCRRVSEKETVAGNQLCEENP